MPTVKKSRSGKRVALEQNLSSVEEERRRQLGPRVTVTTIPDDVLLEIFDFYLLGSYRKDTWMKLAHVCKMWRCIVFASPRRLRLQLVCTNKTPVQNSLDIWPALPIVIVSNNRGSKLRGLKNIIAALKQHSRVCKIDIRYIPNAFVKKIRAMKTRHPFPALTYLSFRSENDIINVPSLPDSFLGGSAPQLREIHLSGIPFPGLPKLLLSTGNLVKLELRGIPLSGYISPEAMVTCLSALARLQTLRLEFRSPRSRAHRQNRLLPRPTRFVLSTLAYFYFKGDSEYLEDIVAHIDTPRLDGLEIMFFNQLIFDTPLLHHFISRTEIVKLLHQADIILNMNRVSFNIVRQEGNSQWRRTILSSSSLCRPLDWQLSSLAQICDSALFPLPTVYCLVITGYLGDWQDVMDNTQWLEVLNPFTSVKDLVLCGNLIPLVALALEDLTGERVTEVLPALQNLFVSGPQPSESIKKAIGKFITARQFSGRPVTVYHKKAGDIDYRRWEMGN